MIETTASLFVSLGLKSAGYNYIVLDEGWQAGARTPAGEITHNATKFPDGMLSLSRYLHKKGLKLGLYGDSGILTCGFNPGSWGYEERDAATLAAWEVDYWKYDNCGGFEAMTEPPQVRFAAMRDALNAVDRDIFYSLCEWGYQYPWYWADGKLSHSTATSLVMLVLTVAQRLANPTVCLETLPPNSSMKQAASARQPTVSVLAMLAALL